NGIMLARAEAALFGTLAVLGVWWLALLLFGDRVAWIAAIVATFYPGAIALSVLVLSEAPFCPLLLLQLGLWVCASRAAKRWQAVGWGLGAGLATGAATLMRPSWLLFTPLAAAVVVLLPQKCHRLAGFGTVAWGPGADRPSATICHRIGVACWMMLGLVIVLMPWWIRNACVTGRVVPTTLQVGASLYDGLNPEATGSSNMDFVRGFVERETRDGNGTNASATYRDFWGPLEVRLDRQMREEAIDWARAHPGLALQLAGTKFLRMWNIWPNEPQLARSWLVRLGVVFTYTPLLILAIMGVWRTLPLGWPYILCWLPAVYLTLLHVVFVSSLRYREPAMLALLALAASEIAIWIQRVWRPEGTEST
ncbi:MAG: glycosyltransferase family 39 protein, partial [Planctomycetaceae bacterium]|nr:glycosyltransferase family 39 protein [Planctomycetaceae bacterium]